MGFCCLLAGIAGCNLVYRSFIAGADRIGCGGCSFVGSLGRSGSSGSCRCIDFHNHDYHDHSCCPGSLRCGRCPNCFSSLVLGSTFSCSSNIHHGCSNIHHGCSIIHSCPVIHSCRIVTGCALPFNLRVWLRFVKYLNIQKLLLKV